MYKVVFFSHSFSSNNLQVHLERMNSTNAQYFIQNNRGCTFETCLQEMSKRPFATLGNRLSFLIKTKKNGLMKCEKQVNSYNKDV